MSKATLGILAIVALAACCLVPLGQDTDAQITTDDGELIKPSGTATFTILYTLSGEDADKDIEYSAKVINSDGTTQSSAVSPSSGTINSGESKDLTVTAPSKTGKYRLVVEYDVDDEKVGEDTYSFKVIDPIVLKVNLKADDVSLSLEEFGVYFYIDDVKMEDSYTTVSLASDGTGSVSYEWVADPDTNKHTFKVVPVGGTTMISGLDEEHVFYAHDDSYTWLIVVSLILIIGLIIIAAYVYRKPVKNYGKPKSRR